MKYKEYWLHKAFKMPWTVHEHDITDGNPQHLEKCFKVIEYQALLDEAEAHKKTAAVLQKEILRRDSFIDALQNYSIEIINDIEKLQKQNEKLRDAFVVIEKELEWMKKTCTKLIKDKPDRDWIVEEDFDKWHSVLMIKKAIKEIEDEK